MLPAKYEKWEGVAVCGIVIVGLMTILCIAFCFAYCCRWERLMTQVRIQKDNAQRKKLKASA